MAKVTSLILAVALFLSAALPAQSPKGARPAPGPLGAVKTEDRCQAKTKSGIQCRRKASGGSHYCWQHGGKKKEPG